MTDLKHTNVAAIHLEARAGGEISRCLREALAVAVTEWRTVRLLHNGRSYIVPISSLEKLLENVNVTAVVEK